MKKSTDKKEETLSEFLDRMSLYYWKHDLQLVKDAMTGIPWTAKALKIPIRYGKDKGHS